MATYRKKTTKLGPFKEVTIDTSAGFLYIKDVKVKIYEEDEGEVKLEFSFPSGNQIVTLSKATAEMDDSSIYGRDLSGEYVVIYFD